MPRRSRIRERIFGPHYGARGGGGFQEPLISSRCWRTAIVGEITPLLKNTGSASGKVNELERP
ncbi:MAG: hypothetical protein KAT62_08350 [Desulfuromonadales bacterium]|nr:hypothetical protein [Desulfuromonadales bacterium]